MKQHFILLNDYDGREIRVVRGPQNLHAKTLHEIQEIGYQLVEWKAVTVQGATICALVQKEIETYRGEQK